jgi:hypothetical protein
MVSGVLFLHANLSAATFFLLFNVSVQPSAWNAFEVLQMRLGMLALAVRRISHP